MKKLLYSLIIILLLSVTSCEKNDHYRIPAASVRIDFKNAGEWTVYGVNAPFQYRIFIKEDKIPKDFSYNISSYTGFGGVLLVESAESQLLAYDLACPVEANQKIRISVNEKDLIGGCKKCGSTYDIFGTYGGIGAPLSGVAQERRYFLQTYQVVNNPQTGAYVILK